MVDHARTKSRSLRIPDDIIARAEAWRTTEVSRPKLSAALVTLIRVGLDTLDRAKGGAR